MDVPGAIKGRRVASVVSLRPAIAAVALVVTIALATFAWSMYSTHQTTDASAHVVENSLRSVELVNDLRYEVSRLEGASSPHELDDRHRRISELVLAYAPLATTPGEATELARLRSELARGLPRDPRSVEQVAQLARIEGTLARLVEINERGATDRLAQIRRTNHATLVGQGIAAIVLLAAAAMIASLLYRVLARQRARMQQALVQLEERNQDLSEFVGRTAHDLRGPLGPICGYADLLAAGSADVVQAAARIRRSAQRMAEVVDDLTMLATAGTLPVGKADVATVAREVFDELADELAGAQTRMQIDEPCTVACASGVLHQILHNLVTNASKYRSPQRPLQIVIAARCEARSVAIVIEDNGRGMTPDGVAHAFEARYREPSVHDTHGSGLGLSIVKRMVDVLRGTCTLTSELDRGTRVEIRLPAARAAITQAATAKQAANV